MPTTYSNMQVFDALVRQGFPEDVASAMAEAVGSTRRTPAELRRGYAAVGAKSAKLPSGDDGGLDSNLIPNIGEGVLGGLAAAKWPTTEIPARPVLPAEASRAAKLGSATSHIGKNAGKYLKNFGRFGGIGLAATAGNLIGSALTGSNYNDRASAPQLIADLGGSALGGLLGAPLGVPGSIIGSALGGWLLPKLVPGPKSVKEENGRYRSPL